MNDTARLNSTSHDIASAFFKSQRSSIPQDEWDQVTITGLIQIMGGLRSRRSLPSADQGFLALFDVEPIVVVRVSEGGSAPVEKNKGTLSLTLPEAMDYLARHSKERETNTKRIREWRRLIARVKPFMTKDGMTLEDGLIKAAAADEAKTKRAAK